MAAAGYGVVSCFLPGLERRQRGFFFAFLRAGWPEGGEREIGPVCSGTRVSSRAVGVALNVPCQQARRSRSKLAAQPPSILSFRSRAHPASARNAARANVRVAYLFFEQGAQFFFACRAETRVNVSGSDCPGLGARALRSAAKLATTALRRCELLEAIKDSENN